MVWTVGPDHRPHRARESIGASRVPEDMSTTTPREHDQDAEPPTPDGQEPDQEQLEPGSEPASDPDPEPGAAEDG